jgi:hypothetical protein
MFLFYYESLNNNDEKEYASKIVISAFEELTAWQFGSARTRRFSKSDCKSKRKSCLNRVILQAPGTLLKPQKSLNSLN